MKIFAAALLFVIAGGACGAETPADGLYLSAQGTPAPLIQTQDGKTVFLGARAESGISLERDLIVATDNANTIFWLRIRLPRDEKVHHETYILLVAGTGHRPNGVGHTSSGTFLSFKITGEVNARHLAQYFGVPIAYSRHPGYRLRTSFTPTKPAFTRGENVTFTMKIVNVGAEAIAFRNDPAYRGYGSGRSNLFQFSARMNGHSVPEIKELSPLFTFIGEAGPEVIALEPDAIFEGTIGLAEWFDFKESGSYEIHGSAMLNFVEPVDSYARLPLTNLWSDYVSADFIVTIE